MKIENLEETPIHALARAQVHTYYTSVEIPCFEVSPKIFYIAKVKILHGKDNDDKCLKNALAFQEPFLNNG